MEGRVYLTHDKYAAMGGKMPEVAEYEHAERKARALLDDWTLGRVKRMEQIPEEVEPDIELAMFEIIEHIGQAYGISNVSSFGNSVNTMSFSSASDQRGELYDIVASILPVELISAAVSFDVR